MNTIDINCDLGEGYGRYQVADDEGLMALISSCNIACGFHAGDPSVIMQTIALAIKNNVNIGAHPSYPDRQGFGRRVIPMTSEELYDTVLYQISAIKGMSVSIGGKLRHVKAHGALYNEAGKNQEISDTISRAVHAIDPELILFGFPGSVQQKSAEKFGLTFWAEGFADRRYRDDGSLVPRSEPGAVIKEVEKVKKQVISMIRDRQVTSATGKSVPVNVQTICLHSDTPGSVEIAQAVRKELEIHEIKILTN